MPSSWWYNIHSVYELRDDISIIYKLGCEKSIGDVFSL